MEMCDFEGIIGANVNDICRNVLDYTCDIQDGVAQINLETGELGYCGLGSNESENPLNRCVEVYRITSNTCKEDVCDCDYDCENYDAYWLNCEDCKECMSDNLIIDFKENFDYIISDVINQIQEWGYDLI